VLFNPPRLTERDAEVVDEIDTLRRQLRHTLSAPKRWTGQLRRNLRARAIRGSNSIEGYEVSLDDALALVDDVEPLDADEATKAEIVGYRNALSYILQLVDDPDFAFDESLLRSLHFMMLGHTNKSPGRYRKGVIYVRDDETERVVYEGPDHEAVPELMGELSTDLRRPNDAPVYVRAAMAHLNLVMIHPFRDGNGRMARALQTLVLSRDRIIEPEFSSIEEWLGRNTVPYYEVLASVGAGRWSPGRDASEWVRFNLAAHHLQAQTVLRRSRESAQLWAQLEALCQRLGLPERTVVALYNAALGYRIRRPQYEKDADIETGAANRDLRQMAAAGLIESRAEARARHYVGTAALRGISHDIRGARTPYRSPYGDPEPAG
jgi:Fic family protein